MSEQPLTNHAVADAPLDRQDGDRAAIELARLAGVLGAVQGFLRCHNKTKRPKARGRVGSLPLPFKRLSEQTGTA